MHAVCRNSPKCFVFILIPAVVFYVIMFLHIDTNEHVMSLPVPEDFGAVGNMLLSRKTTIKQSQTSNITKLILWYIRPEYLQATTQGELRPLHSCPDLPCKETSNTSMLSKADAVVFDTHFHIKLNTKPKKYPRQVWVFFAQESPRYLRSRELNSKEWRAAFDWTCTYRRDSDIWMPYGIIKKSETPSQKDYQKIVSEKTKIASWMVSNCQVPSKRERFVSNLKAYGVNVDTLGDCGKLKCKRSLQGYKECENKIAENYSFYFAFENAMCKDYITEKFFHYFNLNVILVVRGGSKNYEYLPPGTFINTADFSSSKELAKHLKWLHGNKTEYIAFLKRKDEYVAIEERFIYNVTKTFQYTHFHYLSEPMCDMCRKLLTNGNGSQVYSNIYDWYTKDACHAPTDISV